MRFLLFIICVFVLFSFSAAQIQLDIKDSTTTQKSIEKKSKVKSKKEIKYNKKTNKSKTNKIQKNKLNKKSEGKKAKKQQTQKTSKREKYVFKKEEQNVYKFDEKGNPIIKQQVKKTTETKKENNFKIGIEERNLKVEAK